MKDKALKVPISLSTLLSTCKRLPGWPVPRDMSHDDRLFVAASAMAIVCFLRGGEFLSSSGSGRPLLRQRDVVRVFDGPGAPISVNVVQPKSRWWLLDTMVPCFDLGRNAVPSGSMPTGVTLQLNCPTMALRSSSPMGPPCRRVGCLLGHPISYRLLGSGSLIHLVLLSLLKRVPGVPEVFNLLKLQTSPRATYQSPWPMVVGCLV